MSIGESLRKIDSLLLLTSTRYANFRIGNYANFRIGNCANFRIGNCANFRIGNCANFRIGWIFPI